MKYDYCKNEMILKVYPTVSGCFEAAFSVLKKHFWMLILIVFVGAAIETPMWFLQLDKNGADSVGFTFHIVELFQTIYYFAVAAVYVYGMAQVFLKAVRKEKFEFDETLLGFKNYVDVVLSHLLVMLLVGLGFVFLIVPGIFLACRLVLVPYLIMDKKLSVIDSLKVSFYMTKGYFWTIFGMGILSFVLILIGLVFLFLGIFVSLAWINAAFAVFYNAAEDLHYKEACEKVGLPVEEEVI